MLSTDIISVLALVLLHVLSSLGAFAISTTSDDERPTPWPIFFHIDFSTNLTKNREGQPVHGKLSYDWTLHAQRIDHGGGAYECEKFYNTDKPCSLIFDNRGMYRIIEGYRIPCCLDLPMIGPPHPNWAYNGTYNGVLYDQVSGLHALQWTFDNVVSSLFPIGKRLDFDSEFHTYREVADGENAGKPLTFTFPGKAEGSQDYHFDVESMIVGRQDSALYAIPDGCAELLCDSEVIGDRSSNSLHSNIY